MDFGKLQPYRQTAGPQGAGAHAGGGGHGAGGVHL
jgi:hypothetical protein